MAYKVVGKAYVTICKKCGKKTYGTHNTYYVRCSRCGSKNVEIKRSDLDVLGPAEEEKG